jgi:hypothetical protein
MTNGPKYACAAIREAWEKEAKQRWDGRTHGRGLSLLIVKMLALPGSLMPSSARAPTFEFWRDQNKIRGRCIGTGNGIVVARLNWFARLGWDRPLAVRRRCGSDRQIMGPCRRHWPVA